MTCFYLECCTFLRATWLIPYMTWLISRWDMTSCVWHDLCLSRLILMWHDSFLGETWLVSPRNDSCHIGVWLSCISLDSFLQMIADREAQHLKIISKTLSTTTRILVLNLRLVPYNNLALIINPMKILALIMKILVRLVLNWKVLRISRFCTTLSAIGCTWRDLFLSGMLHISTCNMTHSLYDMTHF